MVRELKVLPFVTILAKMGVSATFKLSTSQPVDQNGGHYCLRKDNFTWNPHLSLFCLCKEQFSPPPPQTTFSASLTAARRLDLKDPAQAYL